MPIDPFILFQKICGNINTQQGGHIKPNANFINWVNDVSYSLFQEKFATGWEKSQKIADDMAKPFLQRGNFQVKAVSGAGYGEIIFPKDYGHFSTARILIKKGTDITIPRYSACYYDCNGIKIESKEGETECRPSYLSEEVWEIMQVQKKAEEKGTKTDSPVSEFEERECDKIVNARWGAVTGHRFSKPKLDAPKITDYAGGLMVAPAGIQTLIIDYLRKPVLATFEYDVIPGNTTTGQGDKIQYNETKSIPLEWDSLMINEITNRIEKKYGKFIRHEFIYGTSATDATNTL